MKLPGLHFLDHPIYALLTTVSSCPIVTLSLVLSPAMVQDFRDNLSSNSATVAVFGDSHRIRRL